MSEDKVKKLSTRVETSPDARFTPRNSELKRHDTYVGNMFRCVSAGSIFPPSFLALRPDFFFHRVHRGQIDPNFLSQLLQAANCSRLISAFSFFLFSLIFTTFPRVCIIWLSKRARVLFNRRSYKLYCFSPLGFILS